MSVEFRLPERIIGYAAEEIPPGATGDIVVRNGLTSVDGTTLTWVLEELHRCILAHIPGLPNPSVIDNLLVVVRHDLSATAYINELKARALVRARAAMTPGQQVLVDDVLEISSLDLGVNIPPDCGFILVRSFGWRKSLLFDLAPLDLNPKPRDYDLTAYLARQAFQLFTGRFDDTQENGRTPNAGLERMHAGVRALEGLLSQRCEDEAAYQKLLEANTWMLYGCYRSIEPHPKFDDTAVPDFVGTRHHDQFLDVIEIKQPFLSCFRRDEGFHSDFNDAWNQLEGYLGFVRHNREYLQKQKGLNFENPRGLLLVGVSPSEGELRKIRDKENLSPMMTVLSYSQLLALARAMLDLVQATLSPDAS